MESDFSQDELRALLAAMTDVVLVLDEEGRCLRIAPTNPDLLYVPEQDALGRTLHDMMPREQADMFVAAIQSALRDAEAKTIEYPMTIGERSLWFAATISPMSSNAVVYVAREISERVNASQLLEERVTSRTRELHALLDTSKALASTLELEPLLDDILDHLKSLVNCAGAAVLLQDGEELVQLAVRRPSYVGPVGGVAPRSTTASYAIIWQTIHRGYAVMIGDVRGESTLAKAYRAQVGFDLALTPLRYIRAWAAVPLNARDKVIGMLAMAHEEPNGFSERDVELATAIATQAAVAIENARLFEQTQRQARDMEALSRADAELFRSLDLDGVLQSLVDVAVDVLGADKCLVTLWDREMNSATVRAARNFSQEGLDLFRALLPSPGLGSLRDDVEPTVHPGPDEPGVAPAVRAIMELEGVSAAMDVPIRSAAGNVLGGYGVAYTTKHEFDADEQRLLLALAERAAVAIQNADLFGKAQQAASLEERQRLARDLHDSVSQALYGIALGTRTARMRLGDDPHNAEEPLDYVASLAQAGLAEMRALIFELRPESLQEEGVVAAIEKQIASTTARYGLHIDAELGDEPECALDAKEALYRIAQEALHNIVKHAHAQRVEVQLESDADAVVLTVRDDGRGFDTSDQFPGHVGLHSMPQRAGKLGGSVTIESAPGRGTQVTARIPL